MSPKKETWQNITKGTAAILKLDVRGLEYGEVIRSGMKTSLTPEERRLNQDRAAARSQDLFSNGTLAPVRLLDEELEEYAEFASNPNFMAESEIAGLFKMTLANLRAKLDTIGSVALVNRIYEVAKSMDVKTSQLAAVEEKLAEFGPSNVVTREQIPV